MGAKLSSPLPQEASGVGAHTASPLPPADLITRPQPLQGARLTAEAAPPNRPPPHALRAQRVLPRPLPAQEQRGLWGSSRVLGESSCTAATHTSGAPRGEQSEVSRAVLRLGGSMHITPLLPPSLAPPESSPGAPSLSPSPGRSCRSAPANCGAGQVFLPGPKRSDRTRARGCGKALGTRGALQLTTGVGRAAGRARPSFPYS